MRRHNRNAYLIIDGYNIINAWDNLKEISKDDMEDAREKLIQYIKLLNMHSILVKKQ